MTNSKPVTYEHIYQSWNTCTDKEFWWNLNIIHDEIPCRKHETDFLRRVLDFTNTHILEESCVQCFKTFSYFDETHNTYHAGFGSPNPDFRVTKVDDTTTTAELKMVNHLGAVRKIEEKSWHGAEIRLIYDLSTKRMYRLRRDKSLIFVDRFVLQRPLLELKDAKLLQIANKEWLKKTLTPDTLKKVSLL